MPAPDPLHILSRCSILTGICRFIPLPFLDDFVTERVRKHLVGSLLDLHGRNEPPDHYSVLYRGEAGSCIGSVFGFGRALIVKPIKKLFRTVFFFLSIRDAGLQMTRVFLFGRAIDLCLRENQLNSNKDAARIVEAFAKAFRGTDWRFLAHVMSQTWRGLAPARTSAQQAIRRVFGRSDRLASGGNDRLSRLTPEERARLDEETERLAATLDEPKVISFLAKFDRRFRDCLASAPQAV